MRVCVFEDHRVAFLEPLTLTRPAFDLLCGSCALLERQLRAVGAAEVGLLVRPPLADLCRLEHPGLAVNDPAWLKRGPCVMVNARWLPAAPAPDLSGPCAGLVGEQVAYVVLPPSAVPESDPDALDDWVHGCRDTLPQVPAGGAMIDYPWDLVEHNPRALCADFAWRRALPGVTPAPAHLGISGPAGEVLIHPSATIEPFVVADTHNGPVIVDAGAVVHSFTRLEGPCYVGPETWLLGAKLRGGTLGPKCRVGGEVEASILQGYSNKYHDGFLGHSYVGEWVNLAAGTQVSDLRNDYGPVSMTVAGQRVGTGLTKVGTFFGDHSKTGLNTLFNTGSSVGAFCNLLPSSGLLPRLLPSFCTWSQGQFQERWELRQLFQTAGTVMRRRGRELTPAHAELYFTLYDLTAPFRRRLIREHDQRRLRRNLSS